MEEFSISVNVADRTYKLTIEKQEEEIVRKAAKLINEKIKEFSTNYAFKDKQDLLAMIALQYTSSTLNYEQSKDYTNTLLKDKLIELDGLLDKHLKK